MNECCPYCGALDECEHVEECPDCSGFGEITDGQAQTSIGAYYQTTHTCEYCEGEGWLFRALS